MRASKWHCLTALYSAYFVLVLLYSCLQICKWNLGVFAESLRPVLQSDAAEAALEMYDAHYSESYNARMRAKLSLSSATAADEQLFAALFTTMHSTAADFTGTFRALMGFAKGARRI